MIVRLTETGLFAVGVALAEGVKVHVAPAGNPALQLSITVPLKIPAALRLTDVDVEIAVELGLLTAVAGDGAAIAKSTTSKFRPETECAIEPSEPCAIKS